MTNSVERIIEYLHETGPAHGLIANTHLGEKTTVPLMRAGLETVKKVSAETGLPVVAMAVDERFRSDFPKEQCDGIPLRFLHRYLPKGFW